MSNQSMTGMHVLSFWNAYNDKKNSFVFDLTSAEDAVQSWMISDYSQSILLIKVKPLITIQLTISKRYIWYIIISYPQKSPWDNYWFYPYLMDEKLKDIVKNERVKTQSSPCDSNQYSFTSCGFL